MDKLQKTAEAADLATVPISALMVKKVVTLSPETTIGDAIRKFKDERISVAPVVTKGRLLGIISEHDLLLQAGAQDLDSRIIYQTNVVKIAANATLKEALILFYKFHVRRLPVVDPTDRMIGIIARIDILNRIAEAT